MCSLFGALTHCCAVKRRPTSTGRPVTVASSRTRRSRDLPGHRDLRSRSNSGTRPGSEPTGRSVSVAVGRIRERAAAPPPRGAGLRGSGLRYCAISCGEAGELRRVPSVFGRRHRWRVGRYARIGDGDARRVVRRLLVCRRWSAILRCICQPGGRGNGLCACFTDPSQPSAMPNYAAWMRNTSGLQKERVSDDRN